MNQKPRIAIIHKNTLVCLALRHILQDMVPFAEIVICDSAEAFLKSSPAGVVHCFVQDSIMALHSEEILRRGFRVIVVGDKDTDETLRNGYRFLDASACEMDIIDSMLYLRNAGHASGHYHVIDDSIPAGAFGEQMLTERENQVLALIVKGYLNKEIAEKLFISTATVIFHRNNIAAKLKTRSIASFTIYAVNHGLVSLSEVVRK